MSGKLTVSKLRDELEKRGLDSTGLKPALVNYVFEVHSQLLHEAQHKE